MLRSDQISNEYFDKYLFEGNPVLKAIAEQILALVLEKVDVLAGLEMGGIPIMTMLSQVSGILAMFVRKKLRNMALQNLLRTVT